jgi:diguanylate cyclase (GGDEF)-like protein
VGKIWNCIVERLTRIFVPDAMRADPMQLRDGQRVVAFHFSLLVWCLPFAVLSTQLKAPVVTHVMVCSVPLYLASLLILRVTGSSSLCGNSLCFTSWCVFTVFAWISGGPHSPIIPWYACLPVFALLLSGALSGAVWTTASAVSVTLVMLAHHFEFLPPSSLTTHAAAVLSYTGFLAFLTVVFLMVWLSLDFADREHQLLREANQFLANEATTDALTAIPNRRYFERLAEQEWKRHERTQLPLSVLIIDVDYFKQFNDACGHAAGDHCLYLIAQAIQSTLKRPGDFVARFGGEEFAAVLPNTGDRDSARIAEQLREAVKDLRIPHPASPLGEYVTVSVGSGTIVPMLGDSHQEFLREVDRALYRAKAGGRDRSVHVAAAYAEAGH